MTVLRWFGKMALVTGLMAGTAAFGETATVALPDGREVAIVVPDGMTFRVVESEASQRVLIMDAGKSVSLQISLLSDSPARFDTADKQKALIAELCRDDVEQSVEQQFTFKDLKPSIGEGLYVVLTDGNLLNRTPPAGQYFKLTRGIKVSRDLVMVFTLFSQSETSDAYRAAMAVVRSGIAP